MTIELGGLQVFPFLARTNTISMGLNLS